MTQTLNHGPSGPKAGTQDRYEELNKHSTNIECEPTRLLLTEWIDGRGVVA